MKVKLREMNQIVLACILGSRILSLAGFCLLHYLLILEPLNRGLGILPRSSLGLVQLHSLGFWANSSLRLAQTCYCCSFTKLSLTLYEPMERLEHARLLYSPLSPQVCSNSCPESLCYLTVSSSPDIFCFQSFPTIGSFLMSLLALHIRWPEYWSFSFSISPSNEYSGLILFRVDLLDLLAVMGNSKRKLSIRTSLTEPVSKSLSHWD